MGYKAGKQEGRKRSGYKDRNRNQKWNAQKPTKKQRCTDKEQRKRPGLNRLTNKETSDR